MSKSSGEKESSSFASSRNDENDHHITSQSSQNLPEAFALRSSFLRNASPFGSVVRPSSHRLVNGHPAATLRKTDISDIIGKVTLLSTRNDTLQSIYCKCDKHLWQIRDDDGRVGQSLLDLLIYHINDALEISKAVYIESNNMFVNINESQRRRIKTGEYVKISLSMECKSMAQCDIHYNFDAGSDNTNRNSTCYETAVACIRACGGLFTYSADAKDRVEMAIYLPVPGSAVDGSNAASYTTTDPRRCFTLKPLTANLHTRRQRYL